MAQQTINIGAAPDDGTGDTIRVGGDKINDNFTELYAADAALGTAAALDIDIDDTLAANSDSLIPTQQAVKAYVDAVAGGGSVDVQDETTPVLTASTLNFTGAGVVATDAGGGVATITIAGGGGGVDVEDEGVAEATGATTLNFTGAGVTATDVGAGQVDVAIPGGGGALVFLGEQVASASASLDFTGFISAAYEQYVFEVIDILPASDNVNLLMRMSTDGGSSYAAGASDYAYAYNQAAAGFTSGVGSNGTTSIALTNVIDNAATNSINGSAKLFAPSQTSRHKNVTFQSSGIANDNNFYNFVGSGRYKSTTAVDAIRFIASSGNITSGAIRVYGITKA